MDTLWILNKESIKSISLTPYNGINILAFIVVVLTLTVSIIMGIASFIFEFQYRKTKEELSKLKKESENIKTLHNNILRLLSNIEFLPAFYEPLGIYLHRAVCENEE